MKHTQPRLADQLPAIVSLFAGAGGLDVGFSLEGFRIPFATDKFEAALRTHKRNFPGTDSVYADVVEEGPLGIVAKVLRVVKAGSRIGVIGGPPCQGFSRANAGRSPRDPRNRLPALYLAIVEELRARYVVDFVVFENVLGIRDKKNQSKFIALTNGLAKLGFVVSDRNLCALDFGVPQTRERVFVTAMRVPSENDLQIRKRPGPTTVKEAISGLPEPVYFAKKLISAEFPAHPNHWTMRPRSVRFRDGVSLSRVSRSFKRLDWLRPSPTIAFGHREIHVHPSGHRRLSIYEAMLLQGFPKDFVLEGTLSEQSEQISNAVPPPVARSVASAIRRALGVR